MREKLHRLREVLFEYLKVKIEQGDWHGVADAAMDIREIEAKLSILEAKQ